MNFFKMNTDENPQVPTKYGIRSIPTLLIFKGGELKGTIVGYRPKSDLKKRLVGTGPFTLKSGKELPQCVSLEQ